MPAMEIDISNLDKVDRITLTQCLTMLEEKECIFSYEIYPKKLWISTHGSQCK
jgi:hypothetical protein